MHTRDYGQFCNLARTGADRSVATRATVRAEELQTALNALGRGGARDSAD